MAMAERCAGALICLTVVLLAAGTVRSAASNGTTTNSPGNGTTSQPTQSTIEFWYSLEQRFMDTVQPKKLSVDYVKSLYDSIVNKTFQTSDISTLFKKPEVVGILTLVILGVLYSAGILIGGLIFCLVQCCCSGYQKYDEDGAKCSRCTMSFFLVAFCVLISFGTGMLAVSLTDVIRTSDSLPPFVNTTFTSFHRVIATTESEIDGVVRGGFEKVAADVLSNLNKADRTLSASIYNSLDRNVTATISGIEELGNSVTTVSSSVGNVTSDFTKMNDDLKEARDGLENQRRQWTDFCGSPSGSAVCQGSSVDFTAVVLPTNYVLSFESATVLTNLEEIQRTNLSSLADKAKTSYNSVPQQIRDKIPPIRQKVDRTFGDVRQRIQEELRKLHAETVKLNEQILPVRNDAYEYARQPQKYHDYIFYSVIAISVFFGLFAALVLLGTCVGGAAYNSSVIPTRRKVCSRAGGCCLIAVVYLTLITAWLFMLLTTALFVCVDLNQTQKHLDNANIQSQLGDFQLDERNIEIFSLDSERQTRNFITQLENIKLNTTLDELSQTDTTSSFSGIANLAKICGKFSECNWWCGSVRPEPHCSGFEGLVHWSINVI
ncbi:putative Prominin-1 [Hypsibius exemplaris]|uniref:Prominin-1 n=1 Tax=Hypsibius exemplaris TaxID=2072580 RepID=A0A1W0WFX2_HYPEX|nr:putative Prominin-1 [Hypsibius exemplaris]